MKNRFAVKLANKVICKFGDLQKHVLVFNNDEEAEAFVELINTSNPNDLDDLAKVKEVIDSIVNESITEEIKKEEIRKTEQQRLEKLLNYAEDGNFFTSENGSLFFSKTGNLSIPKILADAFVESIDDRKKFSSLINFWMLNAMNPDNEAREGLYRFITDQDLKITSNGMLVAYRNVMQQNAVDLKLLKKVSKIWIDRTTNNLITNVDQSLYLITYLDDSDDQHEALIYTNKELDSEAETLGELIGNDKKCINQFVDQSPGYSSYYWETDLMDCAVENVVLLGDLTEVYMKMINDTTKKASLTDWYSKTTSVIIGVPTSVPRENCDSDPNVSCSKGLHVGSVSFLKKNDFGNLGLVVLVNPKDVVAVPYSYGNGYKMRCCKYLPIAMAEYDEDNKLIPVNIDDANAHANLFLATELEEMRECIDIDYENAVNHQYLPSHLNRESLESMLNSIEESIEERTVEI